MNHQLQQVRWTLEMLNVSFRLEYQKEKKNMITDLLFRRKNAIESLKPRKIFLQVMHLAKAKKRRYHLFMKVLELEKDCEEIWRYREQEIIKNQKEQE